MRASGCSTAVCSSIGVSVTMFWSGDTRSANFRRDESMTALATAAGLGAQHIPNGQHGDIPDHEKPFHQTVCASILPQVGQCSPGQGVRWRGHR